MSDADVLRLIERMETWLRDPVGLPMAETLAVWNRELQMVIAKAERGPGWAGVLERAHALGIQTETRAASLSVERDQLRVELDAQVRGDRALKGYGAAAR